MQNNRNGATTNKSSLVQKIKSFFQGKPNNGPVHYHTHYHHAPKTIRMSDLSAESRQSFDQLFDNVFANLQSSKF